MVPTASSRLLLFVAHGLGVGKIPVAPGTFGSVLGLLWFALLLQTGTYWLYLAGTLFGVGCAVYVCGAAERILKQTDPPSVVLDEIIAMPICFLPWVTHGWLPGGTLPSVDSFLTGSNWVGTLLVFVLFRVFDIAKPWPVRQSQRLPGGWGVTVDDVLAAAYVALATVFFLV